MTKEEKEEILQFAQQLDEKLEGLKQYQFSLASSGCKQDEIVGEHIKMISDQIRELIDLVK